MSSKLESQETLSIYFIMKHLIYSFYILVFNYSNVYYWFIISSIFYTVLFYNNKFNITFISISNYICKS